MNNIKHNKFKNSGILFELLIRQITSDTLSGKDSSALNIVKKYFSKTELAKEHKLYQTLINSKELNESKAGLLIDSVLDISKKLNRSNLRKEKYNLIKEIKDNYNIEDFFKAKILNYKQYAAVYNLIEYSNSVNFNNPEQVIDNKITLLEHITRKEVKEETKDKLFEEYINLDKGTRILAYKLLLEKFNEKYENLSSNQKIILKEYINSISNTVKLRDFINLQYMAVKKELTKLNEEKVFDPTTKIKINEVISLINPLDKNQNVKDEDILTLLQYVQLSNELKELR